MSTTETAAVDKSLWEDIRFASWRGFLGGLSCTATIPFTNPIDVVKIRTQLQGELASHSTFARDRKYKGLLGAGYRIYEKEGIRGLYKGYRSHFVLRSKFLTCCRLTPALIREITYSVFESVAMSLSKICWARKKGKVRLFFPSSFFVSAFLLWFESEFLYFSRHVFVLILFCVFVCERSCVVEEISCRRCVWCHWRFSGQPH